ncbi:MAG: hypothetical protein JWP91_2048 [Fibrobacteres bacterium]|nr:hypothetical protein [Fibrobacterota bacterium]
MEDIYEYSDYRLFIKDYYDRNKAVNAAFSYRYLAEKAGINSAPFFKFLIEGKRNLTKSSMLKICSALGLKDKEAEYFEHLVFFNQAKTVREKNQFFDRLIALQKARNVMRIRQDQYAYFRDWHHCIIRELAAMGGFKDDFAALGRMLNPAISAEKAEESIQLVLELGFLRKEDGRYIQAEPLLTTGFGIQSYQIIRHQVKMLEMAIEAFERCPPEDRISSSTTLSLSRKTFEKVIGKMRDFRTLVMEMARQDESPEAVFQMTMNLFTVTRKRAGA